MKSFEKQRNREKVDKRHIKDDEFFITRHGMAEYKLNERIIASNNPEDGHDAKNQDFLSDLTSEGKKLAEQEAKKFFDKLDPEKDALFFTSSNLVRAIETAKIYKDEANKRRFEIIKPKNVRDDLIEKIGEGEIRKIEDLSVHIKNMLLEFIFHPEKDYLNEMVKNKENVSQDVLDKWDQARKIIESDNQGTWGKNYYKHSEEIAKIFPDIRTAEDSHNREFKNLIRLMKFGQKKINESNYKKNIKVLAFSHENSFLYFLGKNFKEEGINNCESISFHIEKDGINVDVREQSKKLKFN